MFSTMQNRFIKRKSTFKFVVIYALMTVAVFVIVGLVTFLMLGFRFDVDNGNIEQNAFLQFASVPSGASVSINKPFFSYNSCVSLYALDNNNIRQFDLSAGTISKPLVSNVSDYDFYDKTKVITFVGPDKTTSKQRLVGIYRNGDDKSSIVKTSKISTNVPLHLSTAYYFNENYIAISEGKKVDILSGSYPNTTSDKSNSMKLIASFTAEKDVDRLSFSPTGKYVFIQNGSYFASYDLEYQRLTSSNIS